MAMEATAGVSMATGRMFKVLASPGMASSRRACTPTVETVASGRLNSRCEGMVSRFRNSRPGGSLTTKQGFLMYGGPRKICVKSRVLSIRASQAENVIPLPKDNGVATLDSVIGEPPTKSDDRRERVEALIERMIFNCRFFTLMAVVGSLAGSLLCFFKGSLFVTQSFIEYFQASWQGLSTSQVVFLLVEAVDVYLMGTVMLIFGMGLYELFVSALEVGAVGENVQNPVCGSNLFGLFRMRERPKWLEIRSLDELKTKLGHVIVMILLVGMFEKSKKVPINSGLDLLCFSASILLSSGCLFLLAKLHSNSHSPSSSGPSSSLKH